MLLSSQVSLPETERLIRAAQFACSMTPVKRLPACL
jgi:hypothetical protein